MNYTMACALPQSSDTFTLDEDPFGDALDDVWDGLAEPSLILRAASCIHRDTPEDSVWDEVDLPVLVRRELSLLPVGQGQVK